MYKINKLVYLGTIKEQPLKELEQKLVVALNKIKHPTDRLIIIAIALQAIQSMCIYGESQLDKEELAGDKTMLIL